MKDLRNVAKLDECVDNLNDYAINLRTYRIELTMRMHINSI